MNLPPLPEPCMPEDAREVSADQMRAYAEAAVLADRAQRGEPPPATQAEPVAWVWYYDSVGHAVKNRAHLATSNDTPTWLANMFPRGPFPLYTAPPPAERKPLSNEQIDKIFLECDMGRHSFARAIERAHGIGDKT